MKKITDVTPSKKPSFIKKEYILIILLTVVVILIFLSGQDITLPFSNAENKTSDNYVSSLESSLQKILGEVNGAGKISVFITVEGSEEQVVLKNVETKTENGVKSTVESIVLVGGKPYVTKVQNPKIIGVAIVCEGADDLSVRLNITEIVTTTLSVSSESVRIIKMK